MIGLRRALVALGVLGAVLVAVSIALSLASDHMNLRGVQAAIGALLMTTFIGVGLFAWWRRPDNRIGTLMTATGFAAFLASLQAANTPLFFSLGIVFGSLYLATAVHMLLAFPTGRIESRAQRALAAATYALAVGVSLLYQLFSPDCCPGTENPSNPLLIVDEPAVSRAIETFGSVTGVGIIIVIAVVLVRRWRSAGERERRTLAPVLATGSVMVMLLALLLAVDVATTSHEDGPGEVVAVAALTAFAALPFAFLVGLLRSRAWRMGAVTQLVSALGEPGRGTLRDALAEALGDPTLQVKYWIHERGVYVNEAGHTITLPEGDDRGRAATEVELDGRRVGALVHDAALCDEPELIRTAAAAAALALDNERLAAELRARVEELRHSRSRLLEAGMSERRRLERDLHDGAQQRLVSLSLQLGMLAQRLDGAGDGARELLEGARAEARAALEDLRELARGIHPAVLTDRGLGPALESLADRAPLPVEVAEVPAERMPSAVEAAAYFVVAESLTNVAKYARATHAEVRVSRENGCALVEVRDDGVGGADPSGGSGLRGLADRLEALDGRLEIESMPGRGTAIRARVPYPGEDGA